jgi:glycosyltransferase involved in cell wall biosynthesis
MAMEKAIVSTSIGAEGLPVEDGKDIYLADTPETFATGLIDLLLNPELAVSMGRHAADTVRTRFGWTGVALAFAEICEDTINACRNRNVSSIGLEQTEQPAV